MDEGVGLHLLPVDLSLFRRRNFAFGTIAVVGGYAVFVGSVVLQPLWMQTWIGYTATWAGLVAAPAGLVALLLSPLVGRMIGRIDARLIASAAFVAFGISFLMRAGYTADDVVQRLPWGARLILRLRSAD